MSCPGGRILPLSLPRRWIHDLTVASRSFPTVAVRKELHVPDLIQARGRLEVAPRWSVLVFRAFGIVSSRMVPLRQSFLSFPSPRIYEHPVSVGALAVHREYQGGPAVFFGLIQAPEAQNLFALGEQVEGLVKGPVMENGAYRRLIRTSRLPAPLRRFAWWYATCVSGPVKSKSVGTFAVTSIAAMGIEICQFLSPVTTVLYYAPPEGAGEKLTVHAAFDHRVFDGWQIGQALEQLEHVLNEELVEEVLGMA